MKKTMLMLLLIVLSCGFLSAQVKIGDNPQTLSPGSLLELESTTKAFTLPRMTTVQMQAIPSPLNGMMVYNIDSNCIYLYKNGNIWAGLLTEAPQSASWPYKTNDNLVGVAGNAKGIVAAPGNGLSASGNYSHAEGLNSVSSGTHSWTFGSADTALSNGSVAMGYQNKTAGEFSFALGFKNITRYQSAIALGQENTDTGWASMAFGLRNKIYNGVGYSNAIGYNNQLKDGFSNNAFGETNNIEQGNANAAIGYNNNIMQGQSNTLLGSTNRITAGDFGLAGGFGNTINSGNSNTLLGRSNIADGLYLGAIGNGNNVFFQSGVALGQNNSDSGWASIAGGLGNTIAKEVQFSASFGTNNLSTRNMALGLANPGSGTFSAGINNINSGYGSMALGGSNKPSNIFSLAANYNTLSNSYAMSSFGHFNDTISANQGLNFQPQEMLFSIGNGTNDLNRRNSLTMLRNGFTTINATEEAGPNIPRAELDVKGTGAIIVPVGTSAQRPVTPVVGMIRFCTDCGTTPVLQGFDGVNWVNL